MESNLIYHSVAPENVLESYTEFSNVDFILLHFELNKGMFVKVNIPLSLY